MTVENLIKLLETMPKDLEVIFSPYSPAPELPVDTVILRETNGAYVSSKAPYVELS